MKKIILIIVILLMSSFVSGEKTYCDGFREGHSDGYCHRIINCIKPIPPICPVAPVQFNTFKDGYSDGFLAGKKKRKDEGSDKADK